MADAAAVIRRLVAAVRVGDLTAPKGMVTRLEGAAVAFEEVAHRTRVPGKRGAPPSRGA